MSVVTQKYTRTQFEVDAVQVTEENMPAITDWCMGEMLQENSQKFIQIKVDRPLNDRQSKAFVGDWVLYANNGFKVYTTKAFERSFQRISETGTTQLTAAEKLASLDTTERKPVTITSG